jgi:branched-chain amino acid transport system permease protein
VIGLPLLSTKVKALVLSSLFAGVAGAIQAWQMSYIDAVTVFGLNVALVPIAMALLGGSGLRWGPFIGVVLLAGVQQWLLVNITMLQATVYGAIILLIGRYMPGGILRAGALRAVPWLAPLTREHGAFVAASLVMPAGSTSPAAGNRAEMPLDRLVARSGTEPLLACRDVVKSFGGNRALAGVSFDVRAGEIVGLVGQNGSGKTTLFNCISKVYDLTGGDIRFDGHQLAGLRRDQMAGLGVGRTYQIPRPFGDLTVAENVALSLMFGPQKEIPAHALQEARSFLAYADLDRRHDVRADALSLQEKKLLEFARALATRPKLLLVDEIASGLTPIEVRRFVQRIRAVREDYGITVIWVEHIASALNAAADRIIVLEQGQLIADGPPSVVFRDQRVLASYLGAAEAVG